jgi:hypothetical protein
MKLRIESTVSRKTRKEIFPSTVPPIKIKVKKKKKSFLKKNMAVEDKHISYRIGRFCYLFFDCGAIAVK